MTLERPDPTPPHAPGLETPAAARLGSVPGASPASGTIFESPLFDSFDGWARLLRRSGEVCDDDAPPPDDRPAGGGHVVTEAPAWVPTRRPAITLLHVVDDGRDSGETVRLRGDALVVGRTTGGVTIPHDPHLEDRHARLDRLPGGGWLLSDLGSRDGTWVRATTARVRDGSAVRIGSTTLVFRGGCVDRDGPGGRGSLDLPTAPFLLGRAGSFPPGSVPSGLPFVEIDDPHVSPVHAEVVARRSGLRIVNHGLNGLWVRIGAPVRLDGTAQFQCGDQRFVLEPSVAPPVGDG